MNPRKDMLVPGVYFRRRGEEREGVLSCCSKMNPRKDMLVLGVYFIPGIFLYFVLHDTHQVKMNLSLLIPLHPLLNYWSKNKLNVSVILSDPTCKDYND